MRRFISFVLGSFLSLAPLSAAERVTGLDLVFGEKAMIGKQVQLTGCGWLLEGVDGMSCIVLYQGKLIASIWADFSDEDMPKVRPLLDHCMDRDSRCNFDVIGSVKGVGQRPSIERVTFDFKAD